MKYWLPVALWMAVIFAASGDTQSAQRSSSLFVPLLHWLFPNISLATLESLHLLIRKCGHLTEYALLSLLVWRAIHQPQRHNPQPWRWDEARLALFIVFLYAAGDEFHQLFVPTRTALVSDVIIDTFGGTVGLLALWLARKTLKRA